MKTAALYDADPFLWQCEATVTDCRPLPEGQFGVTVNQTVFFPEGGGQPGDRGRLGEATVTDTRLNEDGLPVHLCDRPVAVGQSVTLAVDGERRFDFMQQHTGEHLLSYAFFKLYGAANVGFHLNESLATLDLDRPFTDDEIAAAERFANRQITEDRPVRAYVTRADALTGERVRKQPVKGGDSPRVVEIEGSDICPCCGTHVARTGQVGSVCVLRADRLRGGVRLTFLCGGRAVRDHREKTCLLRQLTEAFSAQPADLPQRAEALKAELAAARRELAAAKHALLAKQAEALLADRGDSPYLLACLPEAGEKEAKTMLSLLTAAAPVRAMVVAAKGDSLCFLCGAAPSAPGVSCRVMCDLLCGVFCAKGGGGDAFARGGGKAPPNFEELAGSVLTALRRMS